MAVVLALTAAIWLWKSTPAWYAARGSFSSVFGRLLAHSKDVDRTLADLGLDQSYRPYIGMTSFSDGSPMDDPRFVAAFRRRLTFGSLAVFLLTHPRDTYVALRISQDEAGRQRPPVGNFDPSAGFPPYAESRAFAWWSNLKRAFFDHRGSRFLTCFLGVIVGVATLIQRQRESLPAGVVTSGLILIAMACTELAGASLADAADVQRHQLLVYAMFDILLLTGFGSLAVSHRQDPYDWIVVTHSLSQGRLIERPTGLIGWEVDRETGPQQPRRPVIFLSCLCPNWSEAQADEGTQRVRRAPFKIDRPQRALVWIKVWLKRSARSRIARNRPHG